MKGARAPLIRRDTPPRPFEPAARCFKCPVLFLFFRFCVGVEHRETRSLSTALKRADPHSSTKAHSVRSLAPGLGATVEVTCSGAVAQPTAQTVAGNKCWNPVARLYLDPGAEFNRDFLGLSCARRSQGRGRLDPPDTPLACLLLLNRHGQQL